MGRKCDGPLLNRTVQSRTFVSWSIWPNADCLLSGRNYRMRTLIVLFEWVASLNSDEGFVRHASSHTSEIRFNRFCWRLSRTSIVQTGCCRTWLVSTNALSPSCAKYFVFLLSKS
jgi:hypothetical protein